MPKKERYYDSLSEEDIDIFGYFADIVVLLLYQRMLHWKILHNTQSASTRNTSRMVAWTLHREMQERIGIKNSQTEYKHPKPPEQVARSKFVAEILNDILPEALQDEDYVDACRKTLSIMSVRTWEARKRRDAEKATNQPTALIRKRPQSKSERRAKWLESMNTRRNFQVEIKLKGDKSGVVETQIASLPPQTTMLERFETQREVTLCMPDIVADADHQQKLHKDSYPRPKWLRNRKRKQQAWD